MDDWNLSTPVQKQLSQTQASLGRPIPSGLALGQRGVALTNLQSTLWPISSQTIVQLACMLQAQKGVEIVWAVMGPTIN